uniref:Putative retrotransposon Ty1-copia subclass protein n=1 Tax=Tanacetum cinerariifolium TaxID=118510 RepID=A0A6L2JGE9_TANCI|nr:putative retrotransposon Ty1-copia subclass protein [Tanacetum cinerariifolium]
MRASGGNQMTMLLRQLKEHKNKKTRSDPSFSYEYELDVHSDFAARLQTTEFATFDVLSFWKAKETMFLVLSHMAMDMLCIQDALVVSESAFSTSGRVLSIRRTRLGLASLDMYFEEEILDAVLQANKANPLSNEEIALDAAISDGFMSKPGSRGKEAEANYALPPAPAARADAQALVNWAFLFDRQNKPIVGASSTPQVMAIQGGRVQNYKPQDKAKGKVELMKKKKKTGGQNVASTSSGAKKLKHGSLYLYMGNEFAARILNMVSTKKVDKTLDELWHGKVLNLSYLKESGRIVELEDEDILPSDNTSEHPIMEESLAPILSQKEDVIHVHRSLKTHKAPDRLCLNVEIYPDRLCFNVEVEEHSLRDLNEHTNYKAALSDLEFEKWLSKWIYKKKTTMDGKLHIYKVQLVAKGCTQTYGVDYEETFSPVDIRAIGILIAIAAYYDYEIWQMDVKTAFLNEIKRMQNVPYASVVGSIMYVVSVVPSNDYPIKMNGDNSAAIIMTKESGIQKDARHFKRKYHYVRECIETCEIDIVKVHTDDNLADPFTKALAGPKLT